MDNMLEHPGTELQLLIKEKGLTQKAFSSILGKKVSEVNELLKGKRNITIQRDYLLHQTLGTPIKYWILKQIDYDYSLLDIEETNNSPLRDGKSHKSSLPGEDLDGAAEGLGEIGSHSEHSEESISDNKQNIQQPFSPATQSSSPSREQKPENKTFSPRDGKSHKSPLPGGDLEGAMGSSEAEGVITQETPLKEPDSKDDEDLKNRAKIFRTF